MTNEEICAALIKLADQVVANAETTEGKLTGASLYCLCGSLAGGSVNEVNQLLVQHSTNEVVRFRGVKN